MSERALKIEIDHVTMAFGETEVVHDTSLGVAEHELVCVVGTSGGGKTTLLRALGGLVDVAGGRLAVDGQEIVGPEPKVAMIFQQFGLFPWKTVRENVEYGRRVQGRPIDGEVDRLIEVMHLTDYADQYPYQLSGGMQQRVGIARALAVEPEVLLMDEPFSALDALTREELHVELLSLWDNQDRLTALMVTHDIDEAILLGDRIAVLRGQPGHIDLEFPVDIERPRDAEQIRFDPRYAELRRKVWGALQGQVDSAEPTESGEAVA
jgi:NitT/TauT family transport system ATP-binding protein